MLAPSEPPAHEPEKLVGKILRLHAEYAHLIASSRSLLNESHETLRYATTVLEEARASRSSIVLDR